MPRIGMDMLHYAVMTTEDTASAAAVYDTPKRVVGVTSGTVNPNTNSSTFFGDDGPMETASALGDISVEFNVGDFPKADQAAILGHSVDAKGILVRKATDKAPYVAWGWRSLKSNGYYKYIWVVKVKMAVTQQDYATKEDSIEYQTESMSGNAVKRTNDEVWMFELSEDDDDADASTIENWFTAVPSITAGP